MANVLINEDTMTDIADAIRTKKGVSTKYKPNEMADAISSISGGGGITPTGTINITANGTHDVTNYASANVNVPTGGTTPTGTKEISITQNGTTTEDVSAYANAEITVNVPSSGGGGIHIETVDVEMDNTSHAAAYFDVPTATDYTAYANILVSYAIVETGSYSGGTLTMDATPVVPSPSAGVNLAGFQMKLTNGMKFTGTDGTTAQTNLYPTLVCSNTRNGSVASSGNTVELGVSSDHLTMQGARAWGCAGYYMKYRFKIYAWNE